MDKGRRRALSSSAALAAAAFFGASGRSFATVEEVQQAIAEFGGGIEATRGALKLTMPEVAENGHSVPLSVMVDSPMTENDYVESIMILAENNPYARIATFHFTPASGVAKVSARMRLAETQNVVAVARLSDGSLLKDTKSIRVVIGGCGHQ